jgi:hypothetical protein
MQTMQVCNSLAERICNRQLALHTKCKLVRSAALCCLLVTADSVVYALFIASSLLILQGQVHFQMFACLDVVKFLLPIFPFRFSERSASSN